MKLYTPMMRSGKAHRKAPEDRPGQVTACGNPLAKMAVMTEVEDAEEAAEFGRRDDVRTGLCSICFPDAPDPSPDGADARAAREAQVEFEGWLREEFGVQAPKRIEELEGGGVLFWYVLPTGLSVLLQQYRRADGFEVYVPAATDSLEVEDVKLALRELIEVRRERRRAGEGT